MIGAIAFWDNAQWVDVNPYAQKKILDLLRLTVKGFNGSHLILVDPKKQNPLCNDEEITFENYQSLTDAIEAHKNKDFVFLEVARKIPSEYKPISLKDFKHPLGDTIYVVGSDFGDIPFNLLEKSNTKYHFVYIDTQNNIVPLWAHVALAIAFWDRLYKS
jgi:hypothetical protein